MNVKFVTKKGNDNKMHRGHRASIYIVGFPMLFGHFD